MSDKTSADEAPAAIPWVYGVQWHKQPPADPLLADAELFFFPAYTQPYFDPEDLAHVRFRKVVGEALTAAEARGYRRAIDALRRLDEGMLADRLESLLAEETP